MPCVHGARPNVQRVRTANLTLANPVNQFAGLVL